MVSLEYSRPILVSDESRWTAPIGTGPKAFDDGNGLPYSSLGPLNGMARPPRIPPRPPLPGPPYRSNPSSEGSLVFPLLGKVLFDGVRVFSGIRSSSVTLGFLES